jgi:transposase-like protein
VRAFKEAQMQARWSATQGREAVEAWRQSGLSVDRFSRERGIKGNRLHYWRQKLARGEDRGAKTSTALVLLPVSVRRDIEGEPVTVLLRSGQGIKVGRGFDEETLARVVAVLEGS